MPNPLLAWKSEEHAFALGNVLATTFISRRATLVSQQQQQQQKQQQKQQQNPAKTMLYHILNSIRVCKCAKTSGKPLGGSKI